MEIYDIIVLAGQSNAEGYGVGEVSEEYRKDERVLWLNDPSGGGIWTPPVKDD